jgi:hypothetical protein
MAVAGSMAATVSMCCGPVEQSVVALRRELSELKIVERAGGMARQYEAPSCSRASTPATIEVRIGRQTRLHHAFITTAPAVLDAPSTLTLYAGIT